MRRRCCLFEHHLLLYSRLAYTFRALFSFFCTIAPSSMTQTYTTVDNISIRGFLCSVFTGFKLDVANVAFDECTRWHPHYTSNITYPSTPATNKMSLYCSIFVFFYSSFSPWMRVSRIVDTEIRLVQGRVSRIQIMHFRVSFRFSLSLEDYFDN